MATDTLTRISNSVVDRRQPITPQIRTVLHRAIVRCHLPPGTRLSENELSARFGVSRTPVREALQKLDEDGLVDIYPQYGSFVAPIRLPDVYEARFVREALECSVIESLAEKPNPELRRVLDENLDAQQRAAADGDFERFVELDEDFHRTFSSASGHPRVWRIIQSEKSNMDRVRFLSVPRAQSVDRLIAQHGAVARAVVDGDAATATQAMRDHLREIFVALKALAREFSDFFVDAPAADRRQPVVSRVEP